MDRSVVGILIKSKPLLNVLAIKPPMSVITPPPRLIIRVILSASISVKLFQTSLQVSRFLYFSPDLISNSFFDDLINSSSINYDEDIIYNSIQIKNKIVSLDKLENNIRKNLNFGHTIGHAIESLYLKKEDKLLHGEAISIGMICESFISCKKTNFSLETANKIKTHLKSIYPKINFNENDLKEILSLMKYDKKNYLNNIRFALLKEVGKVEVDVEVDENLILDSFDFYSN